MQHYDNIIIGAGISGLYTAYQLLKLNISGHDIAIFEKSHEPGGRLKTFHLQDGSPINLGAGRFNKKKHILLSQLVTELKLDVVEFHYTKNPSNNKSTLSELNSLGKISSSSNIKQHLDPIFLNQLMRDCGYDILDNDDLSLAEAIKILEDHPETTTSTHEEPEWIQLKQGFQILSQKLYRYLMSQGVTFYFKHELMSLSERQNDYLLEFISNINSSYFLSNNIILCIPKNSLETVQTSIADIQKISGSICTVPLFKLFLYFYSPWWKEKYPNNIYFTGDFPLRKIYFSAKNSEILIYCDSQSATRWNDFLLQNKNKECLNDFIKHHLSELTGVDMNYIPAIHSFYYCYWPHGVSFWKKDAAKNPMDCYQLGKNKKISLVSDMFSADPGWIEGALKSVELYLAENRIKKPTQDVFQTTTSQVNLAYL